MSSSTFGANCLSFIFVESPTLSIRLWLPIGLFTNYGSDLPCVELVVSDGAPESGLAVHDRLRVAVGRRWRRRRRT